MPTPSEPSVLRTVAPAKINWTLEVLGRRDDGYHEIRSVMQTISLEDELELRPAPAFSLEIAGRQAGALTPSDNLVTRAARLFEKELRDRPVEIRLHKEIPAAAGLGGGSSDAAAALRLLRRHWKMQDERRIDAAANRLGSDVRFFLRGGMQLVEGRGELVTPLPANDPVRIILATPPIVLPEKTARLYAKLKPSDFTDGGATASLVARLRSARPPRADDYVNVFDQVADQVFPRLIEYRRHFERIVGSAPLLAGAGPSLFAVAPLSPLEGLSSVGWELSEALKRRGFRVWFVKTTGSASATRADRHS
jgi:4-diphosphocytidyl-2-C-methyl-D-erythritol kinase